MYDTNNDGILRENDLRNVLKPVMVENGMDLMPISHFVPPSSFNNAAPFHWFSPSLKKVRHLAHILLPAGCKEGRIKLNFLWILCESCSERRISQKSSFAYLWSQMGRYWSRCRKTFSARWRVRTLNLSHGIFQCCHWRQVSPSDLCQGKCFQASHHLEQQLRAGWSRSEMPK